MGIIVTFAKVMQIGSQIIKIIIIFMFHSHFFSNTTRIRKDDKCL